MDTVGKVLGIVGLALIIVFVIVLILAYPFMWLWNWLMPEIFGLMEIDVWKSMGLLLMSRFLFNRGAEGKND